MSKLKLCKQRREDCFAYYCGRCKALSDTNWHGKPCAFYKPVKKVLAEDPKYFTRGISDV